MDNVICQVRFPPILKIETDVPSEFQDSIRDSYPQYKVKLDHHIEIPGLFDNKFSPEMLQNLIKTNVSNNHIFTSEEGIWNVHLTKTFLSIKTSKYTQWEDFRSHFEKPLEALLKIYSPPFFTRVGLRYIDIFNRKTLNLNDTDWNELIEPFVLGLCSSPINNHIQNNQSSSDIQLSDGKSTLKMSTSFVQHVPTGEKCFMIDSDFYNTDKCKPDEVFERLNYLNSRATKLIQWVITEKLHQAMEPEDI